MDRHIGLGSQLAAWSSPAGVRVAGGPPADPGGGRLARTGRSEIPNWCLVRPGGFSRTVRQTVYTAGGRACVRGPPAARPHDRTIPLSGGPPIGTMSDPIWKNSRPGAGRDGTAIDCARTKNTQITHRPHPRAVPRRSGLHPSGLHPSGLHPSGRRRTGGYWPSRRPTGRRPQGRHQSGRRL